MDAANGQRTVVVTGAGSGLGRAITQRLLREGFQCVLAGPYEPALQETVVQAGVSESKGTTVVCDIRLPEDRIRLIDHAAQRPGSLFGLVNNAGISRGHPLLDETVDDWRDTCETNLEAAHFLCQLAFEAMRREGEGRVVNIASIYGLTGVDHRPYGARGPVTTPGDRGPMMQSAYAASKGGLIQLTRYLASAVGRWGITVNSISPGVVPHPEYDIDRQRISQDQLRRQDRGRAAAETESTAQKRPGLGQQVDPQILEAIEAEVPLGRLGRVEDIAGPVRFLLSEDASYITGANLVVDGGFTIW